MSEQSYVVTKKQIIKAKNMTHARMLSEGYKDFPGQIIHLHHFMQSQSITEV